MSNFKKIVVMNFSGNVGKSTIAAHLLSPRMPEAKIFSVESINSGADSSGVEVEILKGKKFGNLLEAVALLDEAIIAVGASNVEQFLHQMQQYDGSHEDFDLFIIPAVKENKVITDTVNTIKSLDKLEIPRDKIQVVFNRVETDDEIEDVFAPIFGIAKLMPGVKVATNAAVYNNEIFERLKPLKLNIADIINDKTDYREVIRTAKTDEEKTEASTMMALTRLGRTAEKNLAKVYEAIA